MNNNLHININPLTWGTVIDKYYKTNHDILYQHCVVQNHDGLVFKVISHHDDSNFLHHHVFLFKQGVEILQFKDNEINNFMYLRIIKHNNLYNYKIIFNPI